MRCAAVCELQAAGRLPFLQRLDHGRRSRRCLLRLRCGLKQRLGLLCRMLLSALVGLRPQQLGTGSSEPELAAGGLLAIPQLFARETTQLSCPRSRGRPGCGWHLCSHCRTCRRPPASAETCVALALLRERDDNLPASRLIVVQHHTGMLIQRKPREDEKRRVQACKARRRHLSTNTAPRAPATQAGTGC